MHRVKPSLSKNHSFPTQFQLTIFVSLQALSCFVCIQITRRNAFQWWWQLYHTVNFVVYPSKQLHWPQNRQKISASIALKKSISYWKIPFKWKQSHLFPPNPTPIQSKYLQCGCRSWLLFLMPSYGTFESFKVGLFCVLLMTPNPSHHPSHPFPAAICYSLIVVLNPRVVVSIPLLSSHLEVDANVQKPKLIGWLLCAAN